MPADTINLKRDLISITEGPAAATCGTMPLPREWLKFLATMRAHDLASSVSEWPELHPHTQLEQIVRR